MKAIIGSIAGLIGLFSTAYGSVWFLDSRYAAAQEVGDIKWSILKEQIRNIRRDLRDLPNDPGLLEDLDIAIDRLCRQFPEDRECKGAGQ